VLGWAPNILLSVSLAWTLTGGQCVFCPDTQATQSSQHDCCKHGRPPQRGQTDSRDSHDKLCPGHGAAFENYGKAEIERPDVIQAFLPVAAPDKTFGVFIPGDIQAVRHPPPELCLLNSVLLI
jgi:hypothetical protein